jgi:flavorubredoxin
MGRGKPSIGSMKKPVKKTISKQDRKDLKILADDFGLLYRGDVQDIIETCKSYSEGQQKIMRVYTTVYLN